MHVHVKLIRNKSNNQSMGYCFVEFVSPELARRALESLGGSVIPGTNVTFKLNYSSGASASGFVPPPAQEYPIFVGDLSREVNDAMLLAAFQEKYKSVKSAKVVIDPASNCSRGFGFVKFGNESEAISSMTEMQGVTVGSRAIRVSVATQKSKIGPTVSTNSAPTSLFETDANGTKVYVGGLNTAISEQELVQYFTPLGEVVSVKIHTNRGCAFIQYRNQSSAEQAISQLNGTLIGGQSVRVSWARTALAGGSTSTTPTTTTSLPIPTSIPPPILNPSLFPNTYNSYENTQTSMFQGYSGLTNQSPYEQSQPITPNILQSQIVITKTQPDPLDPVSVSEENQRYALEKNRCYQVSYKLQYLGANFQEQKYPLPNPLLY